MTWAHVRLALLLALPVSAQSPSIAKMPELPQPFILRDWSAVARSFDALVLLLTLCPADDKLSHAGPHLLCNDRVIDWQRSD
ncbi:MAG: hypothetical protein ACI8W8_001719 [Rhodothermales bacterium]|jgi:hypothetical protein